MHVSDMISPGLVLNKNYHICTRGTNNYFKYTCIWRNWWLITLISISTKSRWWTFKVPWKWVVTRGPEWVSVSCLTTQQTHVYIDWNLLCVDIIWKGAQPQTRVTKIENTKSAALSMWCQQLYTMDIPGLWKPGQKLIWLESQRWG